MKPRPPFATFLVTTRRDAGFSRAGLAKKLGVKVRTLASWETGQRTMDLATYSEWAAVLSLDTLTVAYGVRLAFPVKA